MWHNIWLAVQSSQGHLGHDHVILCHDPTKMMDEPVAAGRPLAEQSRWELLRALLKDGWSHDVAAPRQRTATIEPYSRRSGNNIFLAEAWQGSTAACVFEVPLAFLDARQR